MSKVGAIRPCPFCGSANVKVEVDPLIAGRVSVFCKSCKAHGPIVRSERYAVTSWNDGVRRVVMDGGERLADGLEADRAAACDIEGAETDPSCAKTGESGRNPDIEGAKSRIRCGQSTETVDSPSWYAAGAVETIDKVEAVVAGLPGVPAFLLGQVVRYVDRAGMKDEAAVDLGKANNYAHRLVRGKWRDHC